MNSKPKPCEIFSESARVTKLLQEHHRLSSQVEDLEEALMLLKTSRSWRMTAPLRKSRLVLNYLRSYFSLHAHELYFSSVTGALEKGNRWELIDPAAQFTIASSKGRMPVGWTRFSRGTSDPASATEFALYIDEGEGFSEHSKQLISFAQSGTCLLRLPRLVRALRLDSLDALQKSIPTTFEAKEFSGPRVVLKKIFDLIRRTPARKLPALIASSGKALRSGGVLALEAQILGVQLSTRDKNKLYRAWIKRNDRMGDRDRALLRHKAEAFPRKPLMSILMPVYNTPERWLREAIQSILNQIYQNWELCIVDDASSRPNVRKVLQEFAQRDGRIRVVHHSENGHISRSSNSALEMARGEFIVLMDHDDILPEHALVHVAEEINQFPQVDLIFSDEDRLSEEGERINPYFKPGWNAELLRKQNLISHLGVYRTALARKIGGFRAEYEGAQDWDFALRFVEASSSNRIRHIPKVLYHWRMTRGAVSFSTDTQGAALNAAERCVRDHLRRVDIRMDDTECKGS